MSETNSFEPFPKMARLSRECVITEKIDGTNAQIFIWDAPSVTAESRPTTGLIEECAGGNFRPAGIPWLWEDKELGVYVAAGSRNKWLTTEKNGDNYGFARWVADNVNDLKRLGHGRHFGEFWGAGIQRRYGLTEKRFSLFNTERWKPAPDNGGIFFDSTVVSLPGLTVVPVLYQGVFNTQECNIALNMLYTSGSAAAPGFMDPEGIVIWHEAARVLFKKTIKDDEKPKGLNAVISPSALVAGVDAANQVFCNKKG
jgi:RNA ligase-like protein